MKFSVKLLLIPALSICLFNCKSRDYKAGEKSGKPSLPPEFTDGGKTADSLKTAYNSQGIEFENWEDDDTSDSSLTICFINSNTLPEQNTADGMDHFKDIARKIRNSVAKPEKYKSYYVIFVKTDTVGKMISAVHSAGADIPARDL